MKRIGPGGTWKLGFTLIELMVVIVLLGILAAMIIPEMKGTYQDAMLRSASRELVSVCNLAGSRAISLNQLHRVRFDRKTGRYWIERKSNEGGPAAGFVPARDVPGSEGEVDQRISIQIRNSGDEPADALEPGAHSSSEADLGLHARTTDQAISFYPDGTADAGEILLQDRDGFRRVLRVNPTTARVLIKEGERSGGPSPPSGETGGLN